MSPRVPTYWLSMHVPYTCRHSGVCCASGWPIPLERSRVAAVSSLRGDRSWLRLAPGAPEDVAGVLALSETGHCVFHRDGCEIQRARGLSAMPAACQHFPREILIDKRGVFVTLSHYCPTAADLLFTHVGGVEIVEGPPAIPHGDPEGLDARDALPPLLVAVGSERQGAVRGGQLGSGADTRRRGSSAVLMDLEGYSAWEAHMVAVLTRGEGPAEDALAQLAADLATLQRWRPGPQTLSAAIASLQRRDEGEDDRPLVANGAESEVVIRRYLAAHAFASWMAYQTTGVAAVLASLRVALSALRDHNSRLPLKEAIRETDLQLVHLHGR